MGNVVRWVVLAAMVAGAHGARADSLSTVADSLLVPGSAPPSAAALASSAPETTIAEMKAAPVFLGGGQIFVVKASRRGLSPAARAAGIRSRLDLAVKDRETPASAIRMRRTSDGVEVYLGPHFLWMITPDDITTANVADEARAMADLPGRITSGVLRERAGRSPRGVLVSAMIGLGITLVAWILARLLLAAGRRWRAWLSREVPKRLRGVRIGTFDVLSVEQVTTVVVNIFGRVGVVVGLLMLYAYLTAVCSLFPWSQAWSWQLLSFATSKLALAAIGLGNAIPSLLILVAIAILFHWLTKLSDRFFDAIDSGSVRINWVHPDVALPTRRLVKILLWVCALAIAYPYIPGSQSKAVQGISILLGVMVSLGSSGFIGNMIAGLVLVYSRSFNVGERVRLGEHIGDVMNLGVFAIKLRTPRNEEITLPNGYVAAQPIVNFTRMSQGPGLVLHTQVTIGYDADWRTVHRLLIAAAGKVEGVEREPAPWVFQRALNDSHISYEICCITRDSFRQFLLYSRLHEEIQDAFAAAGVEILSPAYHALRDANAQILPDQPAGPRTAPGGFRIRPAQEG
jgi:small-conductance mechanosensitive channel